jgi:segregation and condensation protein B
MSLKAKLEAVIYAAEEPVTLAQLAFLFSAEALEWKAEQEAASAAASAGQSEGNAEPLNGEFNYLEPDQAAASAAPEPAPAAEPAPVPETGPESSAADALEPGANPAEGENSTPEEAGDESAEAGTEENPENGASTEADLKRLARQRDREVRGILRQLLDELIASYASEDCGMEIREIAGGYRMATKPEWYDVVRSFVKSLKAPLKLSLPALETLAVVAYKQPVTAPEVNEIRGVESSGVFGSLLARKLIATAGRKQVIGRPILYKTTKEFLLRFGLKDVTELPSMEEFEKMAASELDDMESSAEGEPSTTTGSGPELDETASEEETDEPTGISAPEAAAETPASHPKDENPSSESPATETEPTTPEAAPAAPPPTE